MTNQVGVPLKRTVIMFENVEWLLEQGVSPLLICDTLKLNSESVYRQALRWDQEIIKQAFAIYGMEKREQRRRSNHAA